MIDKDKAKWDNEFDDMYNHQYDDEILNWNRAKLNEIEW